ncbi:F-box/LRR-repeat protein At3g58900-like isoform X2 [Tripterygium wilfordii]|nr:F-box/LRR-repeat protein At3g58900-like isoform X2 [Tripterygium wilfordii]
MERCSTILAKKKREINVEEDKISKLPDEVLVSILSLLTMKEAARTSVLARRWLKVWTFCPSLNFAASHTFLSIYREVRMASEEEKQGYVNWVNHVLDAYQGSTIDDFQVHFDLDTKYKCDIDRWVNFVIHKGVKRLVIDLGVHYIGGFRSNNVYLFPPSCTNSALQSTLHLLRVLKLKYVDVSGAIVEYFISACPYLEKLTIEGSTSQDLVRLKVAGGQLHRLKKVKIHMCGYLKSICLSTTTLLSFKYRGSIIDISYANVPNLVEVFIGGFFPEMISYFPRLSNYVSQLETLTICVPVLQDEDDMEDREPPEFPLLTKVKNLNLRVCAYNHESLLVFDSLMKAVPSLDRLVVQLTNSEETIKRRRRTQEVPESPLRCLRVAELVGFLGRTPEMEFATYLIKNAVMLEKFIIDPIPHRYIPWKFDDVRFKNIQASRKSAMRLRSKFSLGNKLVLRNF